MKILEKKLDDLISQNQQALSFVNWIQNNSDYKDLIHKINKNKLILILYRENKDIYEFKILENQFKYTYTEEQLINLDVVNLILSINEFQKNNISLSKQCLKAIKDKQLKSLCEDLIEKFRFEMQLELLEKDGVETISLNYVIP